ncbi:MAG: STM3941 family protein [Terrisporobacter sp.]|uniref:STM3941 family protein n=1 Tax=Terrisporobacter sp. TaxID=1965305 RepID=UPI002FCBDB65
MEKEIVYKRSRRDIVMYLLLAIMADLGCMYAIQSNSVILGSIGIIIFGVSTLYLFVRLIVPNAILTVNSQGIMTKYTKGQYIDWNDIYEIYIDMDTYKNKPVNVLAIKLRNEEEPKKNIKFSKPKSQVRGDHNINLQYSDGSLEEAIKEIREFYRKNIR